jgi:hypothetical protein
MDTGKLSAWFFVLMILVSNVPVSAAATNSATLTYSGTATGNYTLNLTGQMDADSVDINITSLSSSAGTYDYWISSDLAYVYVPVNVDASDSIELKIEKTSGYSPDGTSVFAFFDDFDRADSGTIGNDWSESSNGNAQILDNRVRIGLDTLVYRSFDSRGYIMEVDAQLSNTYENKIYATTNGNFATGLNAGYRRDSSTARIYDSITTKRSTAFTSSTSEYSMEFLVLDDYSSEFRVWLLDSESRPDTATVSYGAFTPAVTAQNVGFSSNTGSGNYHYFDNYRIRQYTENEPTITITDQGSYYEVDVQNNEALDLTDYQILIDASELSISSNTESLRIADAITPDFELMASVQGDSETHYFNDTITEQSYSLTPTDSINQISFIADDSNAIYEYEVNINFDNTAPTISDISPVGDLQELEITLSANVSDVDMDNGYDNVTVEFYVSDELVDTVNITESGTVTSGPYTYPDGGSYDWYIVATDELGGITTSDTEQFSVPSVFQVRDATTLEIVDEAEVEVRFYDTGELQETVVKTTSVGIVDLTGLPTSSEFVVVVRADGYFVRNTLVESLYDQNLIYIIPETESNNSLVLEITDYTGKYPAVDSKIFIQRAINVSAIDETLEPGTYDWETMSGDYIGADQTFQDTLIDNERYRFVVKNSDGESRVIGQYNSLDSESLNLVVGELEWEFSRDPGYYAEAWYVDTTDEEEIDNGIIRFQYYDDANLTSSLAVTCYERDNETNVIYTDSTSGTLGEYAASIPLTGEDQINTNWIVDYTIVRDGETLSFTLPISPDGGYTEWPIDGEMGALILGILVLFFALMFGGAVASKGAVILCALVAGIQFIGFYVAPWGVIIFVSAVAVLFLITDTSGDGIQ